MRRRVERLEKEGRKTSGGETPKDFCGERAQKDFCFEAKRPRRERCRRTNEKRKKLEKFIDFIY